MENKDKIQKYMQLYMSLGICFGLSLGFALGTVLFTDHRTMGMCIGMPIGMCIGMAIGAAKDKHLNEIMMKITKIETVQGASDIIVYAQDKDGTEKQYPVSQKIVQEQKLSVGDRIAQEESGILISLESK